MKTAEFTSVARRSEDVESTSIEEFDASPPPAPVKPGNARLRYALLIGIALSAAWLAFTINSSINEIDAEVQMIHEKLLLPTH